MADLSPSAFARAVRAYVAQAGKKRKAVFVQQLLENETAIVKPADVQNAMLTLDKENSQKPVKRVLRPIFEALLDYDGVLGTLAQADPMPSCLIWGGMKAVLECFRRYNNLYDRIEGQLKKLLMEIRRLNEYEALFNKSDDMQELLTSSYLGIIRFWERVEEQCSTPEFILAAKSLTSFATRKLDEILADIAEDSDNIAKLVPIVQERLRRGEQEDAAVERRKAGVALEQLLKVNQEGREARRRAEVCDWIRQGGTLNASNMRHQSQREKEAHPGTGKWLFEAPSFRNWLAPNSPANIFWLSGGPGVGKSVMCAHAVKHIRASQPTSAVVVQYFSFDESDNLFTVYRHIAEQLFHELYGPKQRQDIPDEVYEFVQFPSNESTLQALIQVLIVELRCTYLFIDGLDEHYGGDGRRWQNASDLVLFLANLARQPDSHLKLWCSSQDRSKIRDLLEGAERFQFSDNTNSQDIESVFVTALASRDHSELDPLTKFRVLHNLKKQVKGNFLWARLMLDTIGEATSLKELDAMVDEGLPKDFEKYLTLKIQNLRQAQHSFLSKILSCLVYARRPLLVEEICEAIEMSEAPAGTDLDASCRVFRSRILDACAPLVRIDQVNTKSRCKDICTLSHGSVKTFLIRNPSVLSTKANDCEVSPRLLAESTIKYLQQPRYKKPLTRGPDTFFTASRQDIIDHYFLNYCAKYWHRHMDDLPYSAELGTRVESFLRSTNFATLLQVQSLLVDGQFLFWLRGSRTNGRHLVRILPRWFTEQHQGGEDLRHQYHAAIGEWGYYLSFHSAITGIYPGETDRCLWNSLGKANFLHKVPSRFKSFSFSQVQNSLPAEATDTTTNTTLLFEWVASTGKEIFVFKLELNRSDEADEHAHIRGERWIVVRSRSPKISDTCSISIPAEDLRLYQLPLREQLPGRASLVAVSRDGRLLRVGSALYAITTDFKFQPIRFLDEEKAGYMDDLACHGTYFAIASRQKITEANLDLDAVGQEHERKEEYVNERSSDNISNTSDNASDSGDDSDRIHDGDDESSESGGGGDGENDTSGSSDKQEAGDCNNETSEAKPELLRIDSISVASELFYEDLQRNPSLEVPDDSDEFKSDSTESNSARESWSEGSTATGSDEIENELIWNDYASNSSESIDDVEDEYFASDDDGSREDGLDADDISKAGSVSASYNTSSSDSGDSDAESKSSWKKELEPSRRESNSFGENESGSASAGLESDLDSSRSRSFRDSDGDSGSFDDSNTSSQQGGMAIDQLLRSGNEKAANGQHISEIYIFQRQSDPTISCRRIFRFRRASPGPLFSSPPAFHPVADLVVWPLGGDEVLFSHFGEKTYFTRLISSGYADGISTHISMQCHFSPCGQYLHMASLDGCKVNASSIEVDGVGRVLLNDEEPTTMQLRMHLSTYRLSRRKVARSPPRLIFRTSVDLGLKFTETDKLSVSHLPYALTWTDEYLYVSVSQVILTVFRMPLFRAIEERDKKEMPNLRKAVFKTPEEHVYLPASSTTRKVHFFPEPPVSTELPSQKSGVSSSGSSLKAKEKAKPKAEADRPEYCATIILGARNMDSERKTEPGGSDISSVPPQGIYLTTAQLGRWKEAELENEEDLRKLKRTETWRGGQLLAKFEKFDRSEDCDIVPYLGF